MTCFKINLAIILLLLPFANCVKIGVSKTDSISSTTTTTLKPNTQQAAVESTTPETTTLMSNTIEELDFPPKITKNTKTSTTSKPTTTVTTPVLETTTSTSLPATTTGNFSNETTSALPSKTTPKPFYCACDLTASACDINCCCDTDCEKDILKVFHCFLPSKYPELRVRLEDFQYEHGLPSCKINDGWLCVFRTNTRPQTNKVASFDFNTDKSYKWPAFLLSTTEINKRTERDFYKYGDPLMLLDENTLELKNFDLPNAFKPPYCKLRAPIRHLISIERRCLHSSSTTIEKVERELRTLIESNKLLSKPHNEKLTNMKDIADILKNFEVKTSLEKLESKTAESTELYNNSNETTDEDLTQSYVKEINIRIAHNFTDLLSCLIEVKLQEYETNETQNPATEFWQKYSVQFIAVNTTATEEQINEYLKAEKSVPPEFSYSGPLGYLQGEPVIIAKLMASNESEESTSIHKRILDYFVKPTARQNTLQIFTRKNGRCHLEAHSTLTYGISSLQQCNFKMSTQSLSALLKTANASSICSQLQCEILAQLFGRNNFEDLNELFVSTLGHPQNSTDKWLPLHIENKDFASVMGEYSSESRVLICRNILLSAAFEFHVGVFTEQGVAYQNLIKYANLKLEQRHDLEFTLNERLEVPLTLSVMFYDLAFNIGAHGVSSNSHLMCALSLQLMIQYL